MNKVIYTHDEAARLIEWFDSILIENNIRVPSPEDDEREPDDLALYGSTYSDLFDVIENRLVRIIADAKAGATVIVGKFSGEF